MFLRRALWCLAIDRTCYHLIVNTDSILIPSRLSESTTPLKLKQSSQTFIFDSAVFSSTLASVRRIMFFSSFKIFIDQWNMNIYFVASLFVWKTKKFIYYLIKYLNKRKETMNYVQKYFKRQQGEGECCENYLFN